MYAFHLDRELMFSKILATEINIFFNLIHDTSFNFRKQRLFYIV